MNVLVVGSGAGAVQASLELLEHGLRVRMIDIGSRPSLGEAILPARSFKELRFSDPDQDLYFLATETHGEESSSPRKASTSGSWPIKTASDPELRRASRLVSDRPGRRPVMPTLEGADCPRVDAKVEPLVRGETGVGPS